MSKVSSPQSVRWTVADTVAAFLEKRPPRFRE
jgi:hypothetical protein